MSEPFLGQIYLVGYNFAQRGFAFCAGQLLPVAQNSALYSLLGTFYGGDGVNTFGLPDLRGRVAMGMGAGPGLTPRQIGQIGGTETNTLTTAEMPSHSHSATLHAESAPGIQSAPAGNMLGLAQVYTAPTGGANQNMASDSITVGTSGNNVPVNNIQPFLVLNYEIALQGLYPTRD